MEVKRMANEILGIMITKFENLEHIAGVVKAARAAGKSVTIFLTDDGVRFTTEPKFLDLLKVASVEISCCDHSCERLGMHEKTQGISYGSQYNNAGMLHDCARVLVF
jgi:DsrE/DsrF-like family